MSQENHPKPLKVLWEQLLGEDVSHLQGCFAENEENKALFHGLPHKMIVLGNVLSPFFICFSFRNRNTSLVVFVNQRRLAAVVAELLADAAPNIASGRYARRRRP